MSSNQLDENRSLNGDFMGKKVAVIGGSIAGLVAAAEIHKKGHDVAIIEKGKAVGSLFNKVDTPFGLLELGMHVLYVNKQHYKHLCKIFGTQSFNVLSGTKVDIGACFNFGSTSYNSAYPNVLGHSDEREILSQIIEGKEKRERPANALEEVVCRFGKMAGKQIIAPILKKLWHMEPELLTRNAVHCFYDLRRMIVCNKGQADELKRDPRLDGVIGNPLQDQPSGEVFGGRMGLTLSKNCGDLTESVNDWVHRQGIEIYLNRNVALKRGCLEVDGMPVHKKYDACIIAMPMHSLASEVISSTDQLELSIYYFRLSEEIKDLFPSYYILCHDQQLKSSRIINYDAYNTETQYNNSVLAVEVLHAVGNRPDKNVIGGEILTILPTVTIQDSFMLERSVKVCSPSLRNAQLFDSVRSEIEGHFTGKPVYFTGMRADAGVFFSHHTIGLAYESAVECSRQLS